MHSKQPLFMHCNFNNNNTNTSILNCCTDNAHRRKQHRAQYFGLWTDSVSSSIIRCLFNGNVRNCIHVDGLCGNKSYGNQNHFIWHTGNTAFFMHSHLHSLYYALIVECWYPRCIVKRSVFCSTRKHSTHSSWIDFFRSLLHWQWLIQHRFRVRVCYANAFGAISNRLSYIQIVSYTSFQLCDITHKNNYSCRSIHFKWSVWFFSILVRFFCERDACRRL